MKVNLAHAVDSLAAGAMLVSSNVGGDDTAGESGDAADGPTARPTVMDVTDHLGPTLDHSAMDLPGDDTDQTGAVDRDDGDETNDALDSLSTAESLQRTVRG